MPRRNIMDNYPNYFTNPTLSGPVGRMEGKAMSFYSFFSSHQNILSLYRELGFTPYSRTVWITKERSGINGHIAGLLAEAEGLPPLCIMSYDGKWTDTTQDTILCAAAYLTREEERPLVVTVYTGCSVPREKTIHLTDFSEDGHFSFLSSLLITWKYPTKATLPYYRKLGMR